MPEKAKSEGHHGGQTAMSDEARAIELQEARQVVNDFGRLLAEERERNWGLPLSQLPHDKDRIKDAIQRLILEVGDSEPELVNSLAEAYVLLAQFITDEDAEKLARGEVAMQSNDPEHEYWSYADEANKVVNAIKADMEVLIEEIRLFIRHREQEPAGDEPAR